MVLETTNDTEKSTKEPKRAQKTGNKYQNKKAVILTGDNLKEMQKQLKANKEGRKGQVIRFIFNGVIIS